MSFYLILEALESVVENNFFDIEVRISDIMSVLMSISLQDKYHEGTSQESILALKHKNAVIMGQLLNCNRTDLKHDFANILLKSIFEAVPVDEVSFTAAESSQKYKIFGCLACLAEFGPVMAEKAIIPNFGAILETIMKQDRMDQIRNSEPQIEKLTMLTQYQEILKAILQK